jgi:hypothetical protein
VLALRPLARQTHAPAPQHPVRLPLPVCKYRVQSMRAARDFWEEYGVRLLRRWARWCCCRSVCFPAEECESEGVRLLGRNTRTSCHAMPGLLVPHHTPPLFFPVGRHILEVAIARVYVRPRELCHSLFPLCGLAPLFRVGDGAGVGFTTWSCLCLGMGLSLSAALAFGSSGTRGGTNVGARCVASP